MHINIHFVMNIIFIVGLQCTKVLTAQSSWYNDYVQYKMQKTAFYVQLICVQGYKVKVNKQYWNNFIY